MKQILTGLLLLAALAMRAGEIEVAGARVTYEGAQSATALANGGAVLVFTDATGSFTLPKNAKARVFAVGGGGAGGSMAAQDDIGSGAAGGGGGGGVSDRSTVLAAGAYTVAVGRGGARVQTTVQGWVGANGGNTVLADPDGNPVVQGRGGGGGGTVKIDGHGESGGCGGGGSWYGVFTAGGGAIDGQGWGGGTPTNTYVTAADGTAAVNPTVCIGGGGGGAAVTVAEGRGGADGRPGAGRASDITGETIVYGQGGRGGRRGDAAYVAADGAGYGFGGDGAATAGRGGAGGDGVLIVRIETLFDYTRVTPPTVSYPDGATSFTWVDGTTYTAFDPDNLGEPLQSAVAYVDGVTSTNASITTVTAADGSTTVVTNGLGRFASVFHLKEEYTWTDGSTSPCIVYWHVTEPGTIQGASAEVTKTVNWTDGDRATIAIDIKTTPETKGGVPNVLILSALCSAHGLNSTVVRAGLNAITKVANVDYYFFNQTESATPTAVVSGSLKKGETFTGGIAGLDSATMNHGELYEFYHQLATMIDDGTANKYDYIVFSFDRTLVATKFIGAHPKEREVVEFLKPFYARNKIIWLVDHEDGANSDALLPEGLVMNPWQPCPIVYSSKVGVGNFWLFLDDYVASYGATVQKSSPWGYTAYKALLGMFAPSLYESMTLEKYELPATVSGFRTKDDARTAKATLENNVGRAQRLSGPAIEQQADYGSADDVVALFEKVIAGPADIVMTDAIDVEDGLTIDTANLSGTWTTNAAVQGWVALTADELTVDDTGHVHINLKDISDPAEIKLTIGVIDAEGKFRTSVNATYNEKTGQWEKNPNKGPVQVELTPDSGATVQAEAQASTTVSWSFPTYTVRGTVIYGRGEIVLNGFVQNEIEVAENTSPEVVFRGKGGYVLDYLAIDGQEITDFDEDAYNWIFQNIGADHEVRVGFKSVFTVPYPTTAPVTNTYDGTAYAPTVTTPTFIEGYDYEWKAAYSLESNGVYTVDGGQVNVVRDADGNVVSTNVYCRVWIKQPGYEDGVVLEDWTGVNTVTIQPRPLIVTFDDYAQTTETRKTTDFAHEITAGALVEGDTLDADAGTCSAYPEKGQKTTKSIANAAALHVTTPGFDGCNYTITVVPGDYYYPNLDLVAQAPSIVKIYDGMPTSTVATVLYPENAKTVEPTTSDWDEGYPYSYVSNGSKTRWQYMRTRTVSGSMLTISYSVDDGATWLETCPSYTDATQQAIKYRVTYAVSSWTETEYRYYEFGSGWTDWGENTKSDEASVTYIPYENTATITILPRPVTVTAKSATKGYDGTPLTEGGYEVGAATATTGFVAGEGIASLSMTAASTVTQPGHGTNVIDPTTVVLQENTAAANYTITYKPGTLTVEKNGIVATAQGSTKQYDGAPAQQITLTVTDKNGTALTAEQVKIQYRLGLTGAWTDTLPDTPTDVGDYPVYYRVDGGDIYGTAEGHAVISVTARAVTLQAPSDARAYNGTALVKAGFEVVGGDGFVAGEGLVAVVMTEASTITKPGTVANEIDVSDTERWTFAANTKAQNYVFTVLPGTLTVTRAPRVYEVTGDGELTWTMDGGTNQTVVVVVDGMYTNRVYVAGGDAATNHVMHVSDEPTADGAVHRVEFFVENDDDTLYPENMTWTPSATTNELYSVVTTEPPPASAEELQKSITITNGVESGWMTVYDTNDDGTVNSNKIVAIKTPDGTEGYVRDGGANSSTNTSTFGMGVVGTGELRIESIMVPIKDETNVDGGALTITVDGKTYEIPPVTDEDVSYSITTNNGMVVISNLVIKVSGDSDRPHDVTFTYVRGADNLATNTAATVTHIVWATYGETDDGGTSWLQAKQLAIIDHETLTNGWVYLAFEPRLKVNEELRTWVNRCSVNEKFQVKFGRTRAECEACEPRVATLSDRHPVLPMKVWICVKIDDVPTLKATDTTAEAVGYWRVYVAGSEPKTTTRDASSGASLLADTAPAAESGAESVNVFGVIKVESVTTNTMISIPWTWYSWEEHKAQDIPVRKLVKTTNLTEGDLIYGSVGNGRTYNAWVLETVTNTVELADGTTNTISYLDWVPSLVVRETGDGLGALEMTCDEDDDIPDASYSKSTRVARGNGLWLHRQNPVDETGKAIPFWIYGQSVTTDVETVISAPTGTNTVWSTMVGNPYSLEVNLNKDITFLDADGNATTPDTRDHIWYYTDDGKTRIATYRAGKGWYIVIPKVIDGRLYQANSFNVKIPLGRAFWYDRRGATDLKIKWTKPQ